MRNLINLLILFTFLTNNLIGQDFSFKLFFHDAVGNKDTLTLGYDPNATDSVDTDFGEINIISNHLDSVFDVRVSDEWNSRMRKYDSSGNYQLKKQIINSIDFSKYPAINGTCGSGYAISIDIKCRNWPVTASWDNSLFSDTCRNGSVLTSIPSGGWWDVGSPSDLFLAELSNKNQVTFSANWEGYVNEYYAFINSYQDTISVFWVVFANSAFLPSAINVPRDENKLNLLPNPTYNKVQISGIQADQIEQIDLFDISGKEYNINWSTKTIDLSNLENGIYFIRFKLSDKSLITKKVIKK